MEEYFRISEQKKSDLLIFNSLTAAAQLERAYLRMRNVEIFFQDPTKNIAGTYLKILWKLLHVICHIANINNNVNLDKL